MQRLMANLCQPLTSMPRLLFISLLALLVFASCSKSYPSEEAALYGTWVNQVAPGDTLTFLQVNGQNILRYNNSFNPSLSSYTEYRYALKNNQLSLYVGTDDTPVWLINSFTWKQRGKEFEVLGFQLYAFMSSSTTVFHYKKV